MRGMRSKHNAKTINQGICFSSKFNKLGIIENKNEIIVLPNFPVKNGKVIIEEGLTVYRLL